MAITTKHLLNSKYWREPREYSKAEALLYLINRPRNMSVRHLAATWQWSKSSVERFIKELKKEKLWDTFWDTFRDTKNVDNECLSQNIGTQCGTPSGTHNNKNNYYPPPILSSTKVESNIIPPKGERDFLQELDGEYQEIVREWLTYKRERKETYKSVRSMQAFVAKLTKLSQGNPRIAREIINQSIANNWAGIFQLKIDQCNDNKSHTNRPSSTVFIGNGYGQSTI